MALQNYTAKLTNKLEFNSRYMWLNFELLNPHRLEFTAGQYVILNLPDGENKRQYSICSDPSKNHAVEILLDIKPEGVGSQYLSQLDFGDEIDFLAPAGQFTVKETAPETKLYFVATGAGIAPIRSMIKAMLIDEHDPRPVQLYWGMRHHQELFWEEDFYEFAKQYEQFEFELILSQPPSGWNLSTGYVTDLLNSLVTDYTNSEFYLCGGTQMIEDAKKLLTEKGVNLEQIHQEKFW